MQFNLVSDQEQVAQFVRRGVAWRCMTLASVLLGGACSVCSMGMYQSVGCFPRASLGSSSRQQLLCILGVRLRMSSAFSVVAFVCFLVFPLPLLPIQGSRASRQQFFSIELTVQCDRCLIWGLAWRAGFVAGLQVRQAYGVFHRSGFGLLVSVARSLSAQPPFATQVLNGLNQTLQFDSTLT